MAHRDENEAARQRIAALERDLADAKAETERARDDAKAARAVRETARAGKGTKRSKRAKAANPNVAAAADPGWRPGARPRFKRSIAIFAALAYGGAGVTMVARSPIDEAAMLSGGGAAVLVMLIGTFVLGRIHRAPESFGGALVTLLVSPVVLGVIAAVCSDAWWTTLLPPGTTLAIIRTLVVLATVAVGVPASAAWVTEAAASPIQAD